MARGLGVLPIEKQLEQIMEWLRQMAAQIPGADGKTEAQRKDELNAKNAEVVQV